MEQAPPDPDRRCQHCGTALTDETTAGLCPRCLLEMNFASRTMPGGEPSPQIPPPTPEEMAARFPQFEILECLGRGGMGIVYKARQKTLDRLVAIKVLAGERHDDPQFEARFEKEARTLAKLSHPNIVTVHDFGESDGMFYLVMEFVDGVNLRDVLRDGRMEPAQALAIVPEICAALQFAHDHGVVHRDIKPENILIDRDGRVKIADFGIAALVGSDADHSGTPPYMAPEQETTGGTIDHRADIYALGVVLYEMLTGERPAQDPSKPSHRVEIDVRLDEIVLRALEKEPARRYQTAGEFRTVVETMATSKVQRADEPALSTRDKPRGMFARLWWLFLGVLVLAPLIGAVIGLRMVSPSGDAPFTATAIINVQGSGQEIAEMAARIKESPALDEGFQERLAQKWNCTPEEVASRVQQMIHVAPVSNTKLLRIEVGHTNQAEAMEIAGAITAALADQREGPATSVTQSAFASPSKIRSTLPVLIGAIVGILLSPLVALGLMASLHRLFPEPQPRWWTASVAGALAAGIILTLGLGIHSFVEIRTSAALAHVPPGPVHPESPNSPEQVARAFMKAIRDGNIDTAVAWMDPASDTWFDPDFQPEKKTGDRLRDSLQHISDELRKEAYTGELDRLTQFTEWHPGDRDETTRFLAVGIAAPSRWHEGGPEHALYLILSSTPDGWRVAHVGMADDDKSLAESLEQYLAIRAGELPVTPPRTSQNGSSASPEQVALSFMEAIRDGEIDAAMVWMLPEMRQFEKLQLHLELASKIHRDEIYAGQMERLTRFAESEFTNVDGTTMLFAVRVTPPAGDQIPEGMHGPVLILSSTPVGWRVVHFGEDRAGKSLSEHVKEFQNMETGIIDEQDYRKQVRKQAEKATAPGQAAIPKSGIRVVARTASEWVINYTSDGKQSLSHWTGTRDNAGYLIIPEGSGTAKLKATREGLVIETGSQKVGPIPLEAFSFAEGHVIVEPDGSVIVGKCSDGVVGIRIAEVPDGAIVPGKDIRISATPDGMWLDDRKVSHEELAHALKQLHPDTKILIQADPSLRHKEMVTIMETCRNAGLVHIAVASKKNPEKEHPDQ